MGKKFWGDPCNAAKIKADKRASHSLRQRASADLAALAMTKKYEASLELAATKVLESMRYLDSVAMGMHPVSDKLTLARKMLVSSVKLIVSAGVTKKNRHD